MDGVPGSVELMAISSILDWLFRHLSINSPRQRDQKPFFRFHPECYENGTFKRTGETCVTCGESAQWIYDGSIYSACDKKRVCAPCISDANLKNLFGTDYWLHDIEFSDEVGAYRMEVLQRTPGFPMFNPIVWPVQQNIPMSYLGVAEERRFWEDHNCQRAMIDFWREETGDELNGPTPYILVFRALDHTRFGFALDLD
jgi:uncharacterized protein CbrC (UPF0167 family)